jgi:class 3 adenylate cyclase
MVRDADAAISAAGLDRFVLFGYWDGGPVAVRYAVENPDRVSHLVLGDTWSVYSDYSAADAFEMEKATRNMDWTLFTNMLARVLTDFDDVADANDYADYLRACVNPEIWHAKEEGFATWDVRDYLSGIKAPTLVLHLTTNNWLPIEASQRITAAIPDARLVLSDKKMSYEDFPPVIADFCGVDVKSRTAHEKTTPSQTGVTVIFFADIVDSTALTERLGDAAFREKARELDGSLRAIIRDHSGTPIEGKLLGDGVLATFSSARHAIEAALACGKAGDECGLPLHLGLHAGDVIREEGNVFGGAVNVAARISGLSAAGAVLVSDIVRGLARTSAGVAFEDRGERALKGVGEPVRVWAVIKGEKS